MTDFTDAAATHPDAAPARRPAAPGLGAAAMLCLLLGFAGAAALAGFGAYLALRRGQGWAVFAAGTAALAVALALTGVAFAVRRVTSATATHELGDRLEDLIRPVRHAVTSCQRELEQVRDNVLISERTKRVAYRDTEREAVRRAIEEDLERRDFASARLLADEFERAFGYKAEADRFREQVRRRADEVRGQEIDTATARIDHLCFVEQWPDAFAECERLIERYGGDAKVRLLKTRVEEKRQHRKLELVKQFHDAHHKGDMDTASDLVHRLDHYLTPDEGRQLREDAREVFKSRLLSLRDRYTASMKSRDYSEALRIGSTIRREFPNSMLAKEAASHAPRLREAAGLAPEEDGDGM